MSKHTMVTSPGRTPSTANAMAVSIATRTSCDACMASVKPVKVSTPTIRVVGNDVGSALGDADGISLGARLGRALGNVEGSGEGDTVGELLGSSLDGVPLGLPAGTSSAVDVMLSVNVTLAVRVSPVDGSRDVAAAVRSTSPLAPVGRDTTMPRRPRAVPADAYGAGTAHAGGTHGGSRSTDVACHTPGPTRTMPADTTAAPSGRPWSRNATVSFDDAAARATTSGITAASAPSAAVTS